MVLSGVMFFLCFCHVCQLHLLSLIPLVPTSCQLCEFRWVACSSPAASSTWKRVGEIDTALKTLGRPLREENLNQYAKITLSHRDTDVTAKLNHTGFHESEDWIDSWSVGDRWAQADILLFVFYCSKSPSKICVCYILHFTGLDPSWWVKL